MVAVRPLLLVIAVVMSGSPAQAQRGGDDAAAEITNSVMGYRLNWIGDSTRFDACRVFELTGSPTDFPRTVREPFRRLLDRTVEPCSGDSARQERQSMRHAVTIDSLAIGDSVAHVYLMVQRGELFHRENYTLAALPAGRGWGGVRTVTLWGAIQIHPVRPRADTPTARNE